MDPVPALIPARMLNEFTYCPRLFHLEWVQARFADNADTVEGTRIHRRVDREPRRTSAQPDGEFTTRSVRLSSVELGVVCKTDIVDVADGVAVPVDYKRGTPPDNEHRAWDPERVQLCLQGLLLREAGYECDHGVLWFAESRTRVEVLFTYELVALTLATIDDARRSAACDTAPPPLVDSPKCPRCSLVGICLPDETNALAARTDKSPRRLVPSDSNARPLYVTESGARVGKSKGRITIRSRDGDTREVRALDVSHLALYGNAQVSTQAIRSLLGDGKPIAWFSHGGWFAGMAVRPTVSHVQLRTRQYAIAATGESDIPGRMIEAKILNSRTLLRRNAEPRPDRVVEQLKDLADRAAAEPDRARLLGIEGAAARLYFSKFASMLRAHSLPGETFSFEGRNRRPPTDPVNCLLSYVYSLLTKDVTAALHLVGFDPAMGLFHQPRFGRPALALDVAEEFRPLIAESAVIRMINNGEVGEGDFIVRMQGVALTPAGRRAVLAAYERRLEQEITHPVFGYRISYRRVIEVQARLLAACLLREIPTYEGFVTR